MPLQDFYKHIFPLTVHIMDLFCIIYGFITKDLPIGIKKLYIYLYKLNITGTVHHINNFFSRETVISQKRHRN